MRVFSSYIINLDVMSENISKIHGKEIRGRLRNFEFSSPT